MTDSPLFREAVEAMMGDPSKPSFCGDNGCGQCERCWDVGLRKALPFLRRLITEENAAKLEAEVGGDFDAIPLRIGESVSDKWFYYRECAAFLRREPTL